MRSAAHKGTRPLARPAARSLSDWPNAVTRTEGCWSRRPDCPLLPKEEAPYGFLRDRLHYGTGTAPLPPDLTDQAVEAALRLMIRRGR